jgi:hypothetical protein
MVNFILDHTVFSSSKDLLEITYNMHSSLDEHLYEINYRYNIG